MAELYPVFLSLAGRPCLVVGGGAVAERKIGGLLPAGARITVVAPSITEGLRALAEQGEIAWSARKFEPGDLEGVDLAFVATSDPEANARAVTEARARRVWVNAAHSPEACDFQVPAVLRRGRAAVAVSTAGASPVVAAWLRDRIAGALPEATADLLELSEVLRGRKSAGGKEAETLRSLLDSGLLDDLSAAREDEVARKVSFLFGEVPEVQRLLRRRSTEAP
ncbi:MAG: bifunctional precorrin-2 dehydrogenase/sirohydrochlorin ferrochelatase [Deltaproteobacteria bacterium]|nr:bifunctional precorrin-2 dehydrogenase/sirohydrochlorin ferrochelatase [Deltaproteobacteria bacterium]